jgi:hypothetical protein
MAAFFIIVIAVVALAAFAALAVRYGVDSRLESRDPRRSEYPVGIN